MELMDAKSMQMHCLRCPEQHSQPLAQLVRATAQVLMEPARKPDHPNLGIAADGLQRVSCKPGDPSSRARRAGLRAGLLQIDMTQAVSAVTSGICTGVHRHLCRQRAWS
ncbi:hypothetical protein P608_12130 [Comamonas thiooxydans]|uniref:Uncharacterized protein n=1 Tax=Comamonas thiooxydans TaxID=363952 RepID=A0A0E3BXU6_9BURK|nr:hypothetical protein P608_12130 [Comamonas thiooxydans]KGH19052.1 hypothetical protein P607_12450 [Comamonas thiooxydans]KGH22485.1 hypothetical protein P606_15710 [Comamonas thiooxydans]